MKQSVRICSAPTTDCDAALVLWSNCRERVHEEGRCRFDDENFMAAIARIRKKGLLGCFRRREDDHPSIAKAAKAFYSVRADPLDSSYMYM